MSFSMTKMTGLLVATLLLAAACGGSKTQSSSSPIDPNDPGGETDVPRHPQESQPHSVLALLDEHNIQLANPELATEELLDAIQANIDNFRALHVNTIELGNGNRLVRTEAPSTINYQLRQQATIDSLRQALQVELRAQRLERRWGIVLRFLLGGENVAGSELTAWLDAVEKLSDLLDRREFGVTEILQSPAGKTLWSAVGQLSVSTDLDDEGLAATRSLLTTSKAYRDRWGSQVLVTMPRTWADVASYSQMLDAMMVQLSSVDMTGLLTEIQFGTSGTGRFERQIAANGQAFGRLKLRGRLSTMAVDAGLVASLKAHAAFERAHGLVTQLRMDVLDYDRVGPFLLEAGDQIIQLKERSGADDLRLEMFNGFQAPRCRRGILIVVVGWQHWEELDVQCR